jgi:hypothetical protein
MRFACAAESIAKDSTFLHAEERDDGMLRLLKKNRLRQGDFYRCGESS